MDQGSRIKVTRLATTVLRPVLGGCRGIYDAAVDKCLCAFIIGVLAYQLAGVRVIYWLVRRAISSDRSRSSNAQTASP
jgi:hypothetical protein